MKLAYPPQGIRPSPVERLLRRRALANSCVLAWSSMWGAHARLGPRFGGGQIPLTVSTPAKYIYDETVNPPVLRQYPANLLPWSAPQEPARTNLLLQSENFGTTWANTRSDESLNATTAPDGTVTADKIVATAVSGTHKIRQAYTKAASAIQYCFSVFVKAADYTKVRMQLSNGAESAASSYSYDFPTNTITPSGSTGTFVLDGYGSVVLSNGWVRLWITATTDTDVAVNSWIQIQQSDGTLAWTGTGSDGVYAWGAQLEAAAYPTSYIPTTTGTVARAADAVRLVNAGLFGGLANAGSLLCVFRAPYAGSILAADQDVVSINGSDSLNNCHRILVESGAPAGVISFGSLSGGAGQGQIPSSGGTALVAGTLYAALATFKANDLAFYLQGALVGTDTSATIPVGLDRLEIGSGRSAGTRSGMEYFLVAAFDRALTRDEACEATANPRQYLKAS